MYQPPEKQSRLRKHQKLPFFVGSLRIMIAAACGLFLGWPPMVQAADLTLGNAIQRAAANQAIVQQAVHVVAERMDLHRAAHADLMPSLSLIAGSIWSQTCNGQPLFVAANAPREIIGQVKLNIPLYSPQVNALQALAHHQMDVARYQEHESRLLVLHRSLQPTIDWRCGTMSAPSGIPHWEQPNLCLRRLNKVTRLDRALAWI